jgi:glucose/arabinose dehydrogenase
MQPAAMSDAGAQTAPSTSDAGPAPAKPTCVGKTPLDAYVADPKLCVYVFAEDLGAARQLAFAPNGDLFVNNGEIIALWDEDGDGSSSMSERSVFGRASNLNHGLIFSRDHKFVYASSPGNVVRWKYTSGQREADGQAELVVSGIPTGGHSTRTLAFDSQGRLIVSVGSLSNVDTAPDDIELRSQIRRYQLPGTLPQAGIAYADGEVIATGMRNEVGLYVDDKDRLWGVENGRDMLMDRDLGGDIHNDNPGEEVNLVVDGQGSKFYGYPSCFSEHTLSGGKGPGAQWADESVPSDLLKTDSFCGDPAQVVPPAFVLPAHWAPLGVSVYTGRSLPYTGDLIIGSHGSWNRDPATGRVVARAKLQDGKVTDMQIILGEKSRQGELTQGGWDVRPVDVRQGPDEAVYVSDDSSGLILKIGYQQGS